MIHVGCDIGARIVKAVVIRDGQIIGKAKSKIDSSLVKVTKGIVKKTLKDLGLSMRGVSSIGKTGREARSLKFSRLTMPKLKMKPEERCIARAVNELDPDIHTVIDIGALGFKVVTVDNKGIPVDSINNDKCASGGGSFLEAISRHLETTLDEMGDLALESENPCNITDQCVVFAESEIISLINKGIEKRDIIAGIALSIASQVASAAKQCSLERDVVFIGGTSKNQGIYSYLEKNLELQFKKIFIDPQYVSAYGAALLAGDF